MLPARADEPITTLQWCPSAHLSHVCSTLSGVQWGHTGQHCCTNSEPIILAPNHPQFIGAGSGHTSLALAEYAAHSLLLPTPSHQQTSHHTNYHLTRYCPAPQGNVPLPHQLITFPDIADTMYSFPDCNLMLYRIPFPGHVLQLLTQTPLHFDYLWLWCGTGHFKVWW